MRNFFRSLYWKISFVLLLLLGALAGLQTWRVAGLWVKAYDESRQTLNWTLAKKLADRFQPVIADTIDYLEFQKTLYDMQQLYEGSDIYILDQSGKIISTLVDPHTIVLKRVNVEPLEEFLRPQRLNKIPIYGQSPLSLDTKVVFSTANIMFAEQPGYIYVVLGGGLHGKLRTLIQRNYSAISGTIDMGLMIVITAIIGLVSFFLITRRFSRMTTIVNEFREGNFMQRIPVTSNDEVGMLSKTFNQMADQIESHIKELKHKDNLRRQLVADISHDLRSPLTSITGYLETIMMKDDSLDPERRKHYLNSTMESAETLKQLVSDLFELSKLEARETEANSEAFSIGGLADTVLLELEPSAEQKNVQLINQITDFGLEVFADMPLIERALTNLVNNAVNYTPSGGSVSISAEASDEIVTIKVSDTGKGIPEDELPYIFERFYRVEKDRSKKTGGTGLGLSIVRKIIEVHKSEIRAESEVGVGTTFIFTLPCTPHE